MKKWLVTISTGLALAVAAFTHQRWLSRFLKFLTDNSTVIQTLNAFVGLGLWAVSGLLLLAGLWQLKKAREGQPAAAALHHTAAADNGGVAVVGGVNESKVTTGDDNIVAEKLKIDGDLVKGGKSVTNIYEPPPPVVNALHQLPPPPRDFTGRAEELAELARGIGERGVTISGLRGQGGVGKTALALKLAEQLAPRYPDAQFYLDLRGASEQQPLSVAEALAHVVRAYHPTAKLPDDETQLGALYQSVLHGRRALLLMDNARDAAQVAPLVPPAGCVLLVTSRQRFHLPGLYPQDLDTLPAADARALLTAIAPRLASHADEIARLCDYLPLALRLAASALAERKDLSPTDYARRLADAQQRLKLLDKVAASISLSYDLLSEELQQRWRTLAVFPATFDAPAAAAVWDTDADATQDTLGELVKFSLLDWDDTTARYSLHDLARLFADSCLNDDERVKTQARHAVHYAIVLSKADDLYLQGGEAIMRGLALFDAELPNIQTGQSWAARHAGDDDTAAQLCFGYPNAGAYVLNLRLHSREQVNWLEQALAAARKSNDRAAEGRNLGNLGVAYADLGEARRAVEFHEQALKIYREIGDRRGEGIALGNLGLAYAALGEARRAIDFYEQRLSIAREVGDRRGEGNVLNNLGLAYAALGETRRAVELYGQVLLIMREVGDRRGEGNALGNLGLAYAALGETRRAVEFFEQQLVIVRKIGDRRGEGNTLGNLGNIYINLGEMRCAVELYEQDLAIRQEIGDRRGEGITLGNLGVVYADLGETRRAVELYEQQLVIVRDTGDRRSEGNALWNMSLALIALGDREQAIDYAEAALSILEQIEDPNAEKVRSGLAKWRGEVE